VLVDGCAAARVEEGLPVGAGFTANPD
jgi:hypothetical protein